MQTIAPSIPFPLFNPPYPQGNPRVSDKPLLHAVLLPPSQGTASETRDISRVRDDMTLRRRSGERHLLLHHHKTGESSYSSVAFMQLHHGEFTSGGKKNKRAVVVQLMSACVSL